MIHTIRSRQLNVSRKDLNAVTKYLIRRLRNPKYKEVKPLDAMNKALTRALVQPIPYQKRGCAHKKAVGPARTPVRTVRAVLQNLKSFKTLPITKVHRLYTELMTWNRRAGIIRMARGRAYKKDNRTSRLVIECEF